MQWFFDHPFWTTLWLAIVCMTAISIAEGVTRRRP